MKSKAIARAKSNPEEGAGAPGLFPGMLIGASIIGAVWVGFAFFVPKTDSLCPVSKKGVDVPTGATQVVVTPYKGYNISTYYVDSTWGWGGGVTYKNGHGDQAWDQPDRATALASMKLFVDSMLGSGAA